MAKNGSFIVVIAKVCFKLVTVVDLLPIDVNFEPRKVVN